MRTTIIHTTIPYTVEIDKNTSKKKTKTLICDRGTDYLIADCSRQLVGTSFALINKSQDKKMLMSLKASTLTL